MDLEGQDRGYAMAALLVGLAVMSVLMSVALPAWRHAAQREKEAELVFRGEQYARAIALYRAKNANAFPPSVDILVQGKFLRKKYLDPITKKDFDVIGVGAQSAVPGQGAGTGTTTASGRGQSGQTSQTGRGPSGAQSSTGRGSSTSPSGFTSAPGITNNGFINSATGAVSGGIMGVHSKSQETSIRIYKGQTRYDQWNFVVTAVNRPGGGAGALNPGGQGGSPLPGARGGRGNANPGTNAPGGRGGPGRGPGTGGQGFPPPPPPPPPFGVPRGPGGAGSDPNF